MKLELALLCVEMDCQEVFESTGSASCPCCGSRVALPISQVLNRPQPAIDCRAEDRPNRRHLRLVVPDRSLESAETLLHELADLPLEESAAAATKHPEGAELADFRRYLEERMADIGEATIDTRVHVAMTG